MAPQFHPSPEREKARYETHMNDIRDPGYRNFVRPLTEMVMEFYRPGSLGLDFGAGTGPVAADILQGKNYDISLYDPFFWNDAGKLESTYDFVICSEVIEHFHRPAKEFALLRTLIRPGGSLFCMTELLTDDIDFSGWWYKNDETHVFFYHPDSVWWILSACSFDQAEIKSKIIRFSLHK